jgi:hypothetical protein
MGARCRPLTVMPAAVRLQELTRDPGSSDGDRDAARRRMCQGGATDR